MRDIINVWILRISWLVDYCLEDFKGTKKNLLVNDERIEFEIPKEIQAGAKIRIKNKDYIRLGEGKEVFINWSKC